MRRIAMVLISVVVMAVMTFSTTSATAATSVPKFKAFSCSRTIGEYTYSYKVRVWYTFRSSTVSLDRVIYDQLRVSRRGPLMKAYFSRSDVTAKNVNGVVMRHDVRSHRPWQQKVDLSWLGRPKYVKSTGIALRSDLRITRSDGGIGGCRKAIWLGR